jgi:hypothetical protein
MKVSRYNALFLFILILLVTGLACGGSATTSAEQVTDTPLAPPTNTPKPTATPKPTRTPDRAATQAMEDTLARVQSYYEAGYLPSADGELFALVDYSREMSKMNFLDFDFAGYENPVKNFAVWGDIKMQSARTVSFPEYSGCGFSFRVNPDNFDGYTAHITNSRVLLTYCNSSINRCGELGKTSGRGTLNLPNPAEASMGLIVNDDHAYVLVDDEFIGEYTLFSDKMLDPGYILYSIISGTNAEYGTRCEVTNAGLWLAD